MTRTCTHTYIYMAENTRWKDLFIYIYNIYIYIYINHSASCFSPPYTHIFSYTCMYTCLYMYIYKHIHMYTHVYKYPHTFRGTACTSSTSTNNVTAMYIYVFRGRTEETKDEGMKACMCT